MAKQRDYKAEYVARIAKGIQRGLSRPQARGHSRITETPVSKLPESIRKFVPTAAVPKLPPLTSAPSVPTPLPGRQYSLIDYRAVAANGKKIFYATYGYNSQQKLTPSEALLKAQDIINSVNASSGGKYVNCRITMKGRRTRSRQSKTSFVTGPAVSTRGNAAISNYTKQANDFKYIKSVQVTFKEVK